MVSFSWEFLLLGVLDGISCRMALFNNCLERVDITVFALLQALTSTTITRARNGICWQSEPRSTTSIILAVQNRIQTSNSTSRSDEKHFSTRLISYFRV